MRRALRLKTLSRIWVVTGFVIGLVTAGLWLQSVSAWQSHLNRSETAGVLLFHSLQHGAPVPTGVTVQPVPQALAYQTGSQWIRQLPDLPKPGFVTDVSIRPDPGGAVLRLAVVSGDLQYAVSELVSDAGQTAAQKLGGITRLLSRYCSMPIVFARLGEGSWQRIDGTQVWGCTAAPADLRLLAVLLAAVALAILLSLSADTVANFGAFASQLRQRRTLGGPDRYSAEGPQELQQIVGAVNDHLEGARQQITKRATVLSGVSHDLGTPATRLRLRAALIADAELRGKLEADIDSMTGMIESVLTYTRSELSLETPRQISLSALVEALVADYQDLGRPVSYVAAPPEVMQGAQSLFSLRTGQGDLSGLADARRVLVTARPLLLQRALTNLVDNALKYGRRAEVRLEATSERAVITVEDEGSELTVADIEAVLAPFQRGANTKSIDGFGLGLTIVATVAEQHGGSLSFEQGSRTEGGSQGRSKGLCARLEILRH